MKMVRCKSIHPPDSNTTAPNGQETTFHPQIINNTNTVNSHNTNSNNTNINNIQNNNIHINAFGSEDLSYLINDPGIIERLKQYGKAGIYGLPKILDEVHFKRPENESIIKPEEYAKHEHRILRCEFGNTVLIKNEDNEWEKRSMSIANGVANSESSKMSERT
jgi:hypothetical protein